MTIKNPPDIRCICAIGQSGQLGLNGVLPWEGNPGKEYREDVQRFFEMTKGHVLIAGQKTIGAIPEGLRGQMTLCVIHRDDKPEDVLSRFEGRVVFIGGGPEVWDVYAKYIRHWDITRLPYDGEADRWFNPQWLVASNSEG
jgi:dihydromethanopterin reductase